MGDLRVDSQAPVPAPGELDALWLRFREKLEGAPVRDGRYLLERYARRGAGTYQCVTVRQGSTLVGWAAVRQPADPGDPRLQGLRVATLSDLIFPLGETRIGLAALRGAEAAARRFEADALLCSASHTSLLAVLPRQGYLRIPGNMHLFLRDTTGENTLPGVLSAWYLTRGDGESDEVF